MYIECVYVAGDRERQKVKKKKKKMKGSKNSLLCTWDVLGPADDDHQLAVSQVAQCGQSLDVALWHGGVRHGVDLLWLCHQQVRHYLCD